MLWRALLAAGLLAATGLSSNVQAQQRATDDSFLPVIVERSDTISITASEDPDIFPGLRPPPRARDASDCIDLKEQHAAEARTIARFPKQVARKGDPNQGSELQIRLAQDRTIRFFDIPCGENFASYLFLDLLPQTGFALVEQSVYEDYYFLAVSLKSGRVSKMFDKPVLSPDGKRFASYRFDMLNGITELTLYAIKSDRVVTEAACEIVIGGGQSDAGAMPRWSGPETLAFVATDSGKPYPDGPALKRQGKDWVLEGPVTFTLEGRQKKPFRQVCQTFK